MATKEDIPALPTAWYSLVDPDGPRPAYATPGAAAFDLASRVDITIGAHQLARLPTNLIIAVPEGYALLVTLRSSTANRLGLLIPHGYGLIDRDYNGPDDEIQIQVLNFRNVPMRVERGSRLAQAMFVRTDRLSLDHRDVPTTSSRGGFGSSGT